MAKAESVKRKAVSRTIRTAKLGLASEAIGELTPGCEIYVLTFGQFSLVDALVWILKQTGPAEVDISTWTAAHAHLERSEEMMKSASITKLRFLVDRSFPTRQPAYCRRMRELFGDDCIRLMRSHCKFMAIKNERWNIAVRTSMNLNENPRLENLEISDDAGLCGFLRRIVDDCFAAGDSEDAPLLESLENVDVPGSMSYGRASGGKATAGGAATRGKF